MEARPQSALAGLLEHAPFGVALLDAELRCVATNAALRTVTGVDVPVGAQFFEAVPQLAELRLALRAIFETGQPLIDLHTSAGETHWRVSAYPTPAGLAVHLRRAPGAPRSDGDPVFRAIFESAPLAMLALDWKSRGARTNAAFEALLGYTDDELVRSGIEAISHPDDYARDRAEFARLMAFEIDRYTIDKRYLHKDGHTVHGRLMVSLARDAAGDPAVVIAMVEDVGAQRALAETQERTLAALREAVKARETFLSIASHELRTPLTPLKLALQLLTRRGPDAEIASALRQVERLEQLLTRLLDVSRAASGRLEVLRQRVDVSALVRESADRYRAAAEQRGCTLAVTIPGAALVDLDAVRFDQVLTNLLSNALKFGPGAPIEVSVERTDAVARVIVRDHGVGIAPEHRERIFEPFERLASPMSQPGLGLGLYVAREIVRAHGGTLDVASEPGQGATFTVELPLPR